MKVLVTSNIETDLDVANGARGEVVDIILHPEEPAMGQEGVVHLRHLPLCVLVRLERTRATQLPGLEPGVIPVFRRRQFPLTGAYAFTDYRAQGQTLHHVIVDIATPPCGTFTLTNVYVALSRSSGRDTIRLLRPFKRSIFEQGIDPNLAREDERLERLYLTYNSSR